MSFGLSYESVGPEQAECTALVLHGILGSRQNFRGVARRLLSGLPNWRCVLVDLRNHGASRPAPPPHTLVSAAEDVQRLVRTLNGLYPHSRVSTLIGHSFGGKVALKYALAYPDLARQIWVLDSNPGASAVSERSQEIARVIAAARRVPEPIASRDHAVRSLLDAGLGAGLAQWLGTSIRRAGDHYAWSLDFDAIEQLMSDYYGTDLWSDLERERERPRFDFVVAERSQWPAEMRPRLSAMRAETCVHYHVLPAAGHWLHTDNPDGLIALMLAHWSACEPE